MKTDLILLCAAAVVVISGCEKARHDMYDQPKYRPMSSSQLFPDGSSARPLPQHSLPYSIGRLAGTSSGRVGVELAQRDLAARQAQRIPYPITMELLRRGRDRFNIYCAPCHSPVGDGDGRIPRRGFPPPPSYHTDRLRAAPDRHFFDVISNGYGIMYSYADRVDPPDRWAIVAYIRALQLSQRAPAAALPPQALARLDGRP